jgi:hypothetical protein
MENADLKYVEIEDYAIVIKQPGPHRADAAAELARELMMASRELDPVRIPGVGVQALTPDEVWLAIERWASVAVAKLLPSEARNIGDMLHDAAKWADEESAELSRLGLR